MSLKNILLTREWDTLCHAGPQKYQVWWSKSGSEERAEYQAFIGVSEGRARWDRISNTGLASLNNSCGLGIEGWPPVAWYLAFG